MQPKIVTQPKNSKELGTALLAHTLCISFEILELVGPEGSFKSRGQLMRENNKFLLECAPLKDQQVPKIQEREAYQESDWWTAIGTTFSNLKVKLEGIFSIELALEKSHEDYNTGSSSLLFELHPQTIVLERDNHISDEKLLEILKDKECAKEIVNDRAEKGIARFRATILDTKLIFTNSVTTVSEKNQYFEFPAQNTSFDSLIGSIPGYNFCFRQSGKDIAVFLDSDRTEKTAEKENKLAFEALLKAFSFVQGCNANPFWISFERNGYFHPDQFRPRFRSRENSPRPCAGVYEMVDQDDLALRILTLASTYFMENGTVPKRIAEFHWQLREATWGTTQNIYAAMHQCAIMEGVSKLILKERDGWSKSKLENHSAKERFKATCEVLSIEWEDQFERVVEVWKNPRNALAHGDLFAPIVDNSKFDLGVMVSGGILAMMLADMGFSEPFDFKVLKETGFLFRKISENPVFRSQTTDHYSNEIPASWTFQGLDFRPTSESSNS